VRGAWRETRGGWRAGHPTSDYVRPGVEIARHGSLEPREQRKGATTMGTAKMASKTKQRVTGLVAIAGFVGLTAGGLYGYGALFGGKIGEHCEESVGCMTHGVCISHRCQQRCDENSDCGAGYHCGTAQVKIVREEPLGDDDVTPSTEKICFANKR
jgi:hypothetical protein